MIRRMILGMAIVMLGLMVIESLSDNHTSFTGYVDGNELTGENVSFSMTKQEAIEWLWQSHLHNKTYKFGKYDCTEYTNDFISILNENNHILNISYNVAIGKIEESDTIYHCWIEIEDKSFEPIDGEFFNGSNYIKHGESSYCPEWYMF